MVTMYLLAFHKTRPLFIELHRELKSLGLAEHEKTLFDKVSLIINQTERIQNDIVERIQSGGDSEVHSDISEKDLPLEYEVLGYFDELIDVIRNNAIKAREQAKAQYNETLRLVVLAAVLVFIGVIVLMRRSLRQISKIESSLIDEAETLTWDATHDALTNVYNRRWLQHKFESFQSAQDNRSTKHSLLYIDLDEFKLVNDNFGHVVGDSFLCGITRELEKCIRHNDTLARMGGDEFAILLENCDVQKAQEISDCLVKHVDRFFMMVGNEKVSIVGCSIGIITFFSSQTSLAELLKQADSACYEAKKKGKNQSHIFTI